MYSPRPTGPEEARSDRRVTVGLLWEGATTDRHRVTGCSYCPTTPRSHTTCSGLSSCLRVSPRGGNSSTTDYPYGYNHSSCPYQNSIPTSRTDDEDRDIDRVTFWTPSRRDPRDTRPSGSSRPRTEGDGPERWWTGCSRVPALRSLRRTRPQARGVCLDQIW